MKMLFSLGRGICILLAIFMLVALTACGHKIPSAKGEDQLEEDLIAEVPLFQNDVDISSFTIIKRQTNESAMTDTVYVEVDGTGPYYECTTSYIMYYTLYEQGWLLDTVERWYDGIWFGVPCADVPEATIKENILPASLCKYYNKWDVNLVEVSEQIIDKNSGTVTVFYQYSIGNTYGYYLVNDCALYEFDSEFFYYYPSSEDISDHSDVQLILCNSILGQPFEYDNDRHSGSKVNGDFSLTITSFDNNGVEGFGNYTRLRVGRDRYEDVDFYFSGTIDTFKRKTSGGYDYLANVRLGDVNPSDEIAIDFWFSLDAKEGIGYIGGDLL